MKLKGISSIILACALLITGCSSTAGKNQDKSNEAKVLLSLIQ